MLDNYEPHACKSGINNLLPHPETSMSVCDNSENVVFSLLLVSERFGVILFSGQLHLLEVGNLVINKLWN